MPSHDVTWEHIRGIYEWTSRKAPDLKVFKYEEKVIFVSQYNCIYSLCQKKDRPDLNVIKLGRTQQRNKIKPEAFKAIFYEGMLIMVWMAIYAVLVQGIAAGSDLMGVIWICVGYTVLLCFVLGCESTFPGKGE